MSNRFEIWQPYKYLYLEGLLSITRSVLIHFDTFATISDEISKGNHKNDIIMLDSLQNIINQASALSRYFWPSSKNQLHIERGKLLRSAFNINNENPLKERSVRNAIEHFDERLDLFITQPKIGTILPFYVGNKPNSQVETFVFRAYYTDEETFHVLEEKFEVMPILEEILRIHEMINEYMKEGTFL